MIVDDRVGETEQRWPRTVMSVGSPGPAPMRYTMLRDALVRLNAFHCGLSEARFRQNLARAAAKSCAATRTPMRRRIDQAPRPVARTARLPSTATTAATSSIVSPSTSSPARRWASGIRRPAPRPARALPSGLRSPRHRRSPPPLAEPTSRLSHLDGDDALPGAGTQAVAGRMNEMRAPNPSRRKPAAASTSASCSPESSFRRRVSRLPRIGVKRAPGNRRVSCATRRTLPVPIEGALSQARD